ncbi:hypothetical protein FHS18_005357 [Paenibacillus phyllosphaerae]|uniref:N-acetyltransferase domain-containing protein n=1 Tax=Paenibacillus phyllosphaerae TaxID=274593 RepID=A0A7W5B2I2_9BACL|nr:GNAT family N-acetyltransferase [Paenibacillus phyllosphaerae]MBB3113254.1 hypothetical protein [Paenibacillus phyllosphaerae]
MRDIVQEGNGFYIREDGAPIAEITYAQPGENTLVIDHTYVAESLRGQGIAEQLVQRVVSYARENGKKIIPACSYAHASFRRHKEYHDVWQQE